MTKVLTDKNLKTIAIEVNVRAQRDIELLKIIENNNFVRIDGYKNEEYEANGMVNYFYIRKWL